MIRIENLTKEYGNQKILTNTSYNFPRSGLICILGASGCGKSTLLNLIAGFDSDYKGEIKVNDTNINEMSEDELCLYRRDNIGFVFQNYNLLTGYTVLENILLASGIKNNLELKEKAKKLLYKLCILEKVDEKIENLSGGQKQRVAIARALIGEPSIILADEPTGALDRKTSMEIMQLLKEISQERLVIVITHDQKICEFAKKTIYIKDEKIVGDEIQNNSTDKEDLKQKKHIKVSSFESGKKNFLVHISRYIAVALAISIGILAFVFSLSSGNIMQKSITDFKEKNTAFNNGYIKSDNKSDEILELLKDDDRIDSVYKQYMLKDITLTFGDKTEIIAEKYPMPKATESMSYGVMPNVGEKQISLSPSLAKKFDFNIDKLIGKELTLINKGISYKLTVCGIFNAGYDDFFVSNDLEQEFYKNVYGEKPYSISYDVIGFENVLPISLMLTDKGYDPKTASNEVGALVSTFNNLNRLFLVVSIFILLIGLFISSILLVKFQNGRYKEIGLLAALGFCKKHIRNMIVFENILLSAMAAVLNGVFLFITYVISKTLEFDLIITGPQILLSLVGTIVIIIIISLIASFKLIHTEPAVALRS